MRTNGEMTPYRGRATSSPSTSRKAHRSSRRRRNFLCCRGTPTGGNGCSWQKAMSRGVEGQTNDTLKMSSAETSICCDIGQKWECPVTGKFFLLSTTAIVVFSINSTRFESEEDFSALS